MTDEERDEDFKRRAKAAMDSLDLDQFFPSEGPIDALARAQNEVVKTFEKHGFLRDEGLYLTAAMFSGNPGHPPKN